MHCVLGARGLNIVKNVQQLFSTNFYEVGLGKVSWSILISIPPSGGEGRVSLKLNKFSGYFRLFGTILIGRCNPYYSRWGGWRIEE